MRDAHLSNFGAFASPERNLVFDVNDFDETLPGPFEWDVKRLAASFSVAGRDNGYPAKDRRKIVLAAGEGYRTAMREFAQQSLLDVWYAHLDIEQTIGQFRSQIKAKRFKAGEAMLAKAHTRDSMQALDKLTTVVDGRRQIIADPPMIVPILEVFSDVQADALQAELRAVLGKYQRTHCPVSRATIVRPANASRAGARSRGRTTRLRSMLVAAGAADQPGPSR